MTDHRNDYSEFDSEVKPVEQCDVAGHTASEYAEVIALAAAAGITCGFEDGIFACRRTGAAETVPSLGAVCVRELVDERDALKAEVKSLKEPTQ